MEISDIIAKWRINKSIPRFIILQNFNDDEKEDFFFDLLDNVKFEYEYYESDVENIRRLINNSYILSEPTFIEIDGDSISEKSQNTLLKIVEEPPKNAYFVLSSSANLLPTLVSRATVLTAHDDEDISEGVNDLLEKIISDLNNKSGINVYKDCNSLKNKESEVDKIDCLEFYNALKENLYKLHFDISNILLQIQDFDVTLNSPNVNKKMAVETFINTLLNEIKNND